ncbi:MAG: YkgJ family cysteine cluster protein [Actinomycetota bacterium]|nr:YkgJ family cysteine cluster protein [Actinomycetota bacterium]
MEAALQRPVGTDVPCGACVGCCSSSQFVHIGPDETDALAHIPGELMFQAPRMDRGHVLMGYDEHGRCPMLRESGCSIYEHRPRTCRTYDCRVFTAAELDPLDDGKPLIAQRVEQWMFEFEDDEAAALQQAVVAAAGFVRLHADELPAAVRPVTTTQLAVAAVRVHRVFVRSAPSVDEVIAALEQ